MDVFCKYLLPFCGMTFSNNACDEHTSLILINSNLLIFIVLTLPCFRNLCLFQGCKNAFYVIFHKNHCLCFTFRFLIYVELVLYMMWGRGSIYVIIHIDIPWLSSMNCIGYSFPLHNKDTVVYKSVVWMHVDMFLELLFCFTGPFFPDPILHCLNFCGFVISLLISN